MIIKCLVENTSIDSSFNNEHGLSLYIETPKHKILFDLGQSGLFLENAKKLGVDISLIDTVIISHGHNDHGGALDKFLKHNKTAKVYLNKHAFDTHLSIHEGVSKDIGLNKDLMRHPQVILVEGNLKIDEELYLYNDIKETKYIAESNSNLYVKTEGSIKRDSFIHEQNLLINTGKKTLLIAGCAHRGIVNILSRASELTPNKIAWCIGGFHLSSPRRGTREKDELIYSIVSELKRTKTKFFTCHCTGVEVYKLMKEKMNEQLEYINTGTVFELK